MKDSLENDTKRAVTANQVGYRNMPDSDFKQQRLQPEKSRLDISKALPQCNTSLNSKADQNNEQRAARDLSYTRHKTEVNVTTRLDSNHNIANMVPSID